MQVLEELGDIIDLPMRAQGVDALLAAGDSGLVASFEGLTVLEGTANNIKEAWRRWAGCSEDWRHPRCVAQPVGRSLCRCGWHVSHSVSSAEFSRAYELLTTPCTALQLMLQAGNPGLRT